MAYIAGRARYLALLLPASLEDYVAADSPVRFIDAFVDDLIWAMPASVARDRRLQDGRAMTRTTG